MFVNEFGGKATEFNPWAGKFGGIVEWEPSSHVDQIKDSVKNFKKVTWTNR